MSLHADLSECIGRDVDGKRLIWWKGKCECGWEGEEIALHEHSEAARLAKREYRQHVENALGAGAYIDVPVRCKNCGADHHQGILVGTAVYQNPCSRCGVTMLSPNNEAWEESQEAAKRWSW